MSKKKTAMMEFSDELNMSIELCEENGYGGFVLNTLKAVSDRCHHFIEKEKQQIVDAHEDGQILICRTLFDELKERGIKLPKTGKEIDKVDNGEDDEESVKYYNENYGKSGE